MAVTSAVQAHRVDVTAHRVDVTVQSRRERAYLKERDQESVRADNAREQRALKELALIGTRVNIEA